MKVMKTWEEQMEALVAGAIDYDDADNLAMECERLRTAPTVPNVIQASGYLTAWLDAKLAAICNRGNR